MRRLWVIAAMGCRSGPVEGEPCVSPEENLGLACAGGDLFWCVDEAWVNIGPDYTDDCIGDCSEDPIQHCACDSQDEVQCAGVE